MQITGCLDMLKWILQCKDFECDSLFNLDTAYSLESKLKSETLSGITKAKIPEQQPPKYGAC